MAMQLRISGEDLRDVVGCRLGQKWLKPHLHRAGQRFVGLIGDSQVRRWVLMVGVGKWREVLWGNEVLGKWKGYGEMKRKNMYLYFAEPATTVGISVLPIQAPVISPFALVHFLRVAFDRRLGRFATSIPSMGSSHHTL
ncbi:hypothetical protein HAX54_035411 [Datura stramonium]|uniref:Uncharacterized protein n=1 Tax=Datura stramonium TaxID=4076 RepID=A0ABS8VFE4_DATST|nr:hypothetical protein [Datura stramonium]